MADVPRWRRVVVRLCLLLGLPITAVVTASVRPVAPQVHDAIDPPPLSARLNKITRRAFIQRAQVWTPTDVSRMDIRVGPAGSDGFAPNQEVSCEYTAHRIRGGTPKFYCTLPDERVVKVRYGAKNGEVQGSVLATRLLWALGFPADRVYPVRVSCRGCSSDPWNDRKKREGVREFDPAVIELKAPGLEMEEGSDPAGWSWRELDDVDPGRGGAPREHRDALKLLAVFMQHADTKREQQRFLCPAQQTSADSECLEPFLLLHDVGNTFGRANAFNRNSSGSLNLEAWARTPIWKDPARCIGDLNKSMTGTLGDPQTSEAGRRFLATLLAQLTERQIWDLFDVAGLGNTTLLKRGAAGTDIGDWVTVFNAKRQQIVEHRCAE